MRQLYEEMESQLKSEKARVIAQVIHDEPLIFLINIDVKRK
jgi:hypothetical protein